LRPLRGQRRSFSLKIVEIRRNSRVWQSEESGRARDL
jgi:hypothetical protein